MRGFLLLANLDYQSLAKWMDVHLCARSRPRERRTLVSAFVAILFCGAASADAGIVGVAGGAGNPATTLGPYTMTPFAADAGPVAGYVSSLASPLGGSLSFSSSLERLSAPDDPWSGTPPNSYTGATYYGGGVFTLTLPSNTTAFYLYAEPGAYALPESITVTAQDGTNVTQVVETYTTGATYFGFYATGSDRITALTVGYVDDNGGVIIGQFAIAASSVPEPNTPTLTSIAGILVLIGDRVRSRARRRLMSRSRACAIRV
jgi:hypothetical protein